MNANTIFLSKRVGNDLQESVALLTTRVKGTKMNNYKNLGQVIEFLRGDQEIPLNLEAEKHIK